MLSKKYLIEPNEIYWEIIEKLNESNDIFRPLIDN